MARKKKPVKAQKRRPAKRRYRTVPQNRGAQREKDEIVSGPVKSSLRMDPRSSQFMAFSPGPSEPPIQDKQAGDLEGLETDERESIESVAELADEGQDFEAEQLEGIENAPDPDQSAIPVRKIPNRSGPRKCKDRNRL